MVFPMTSKPEVASQETEIRQNGTRKNRGHTEQSALLESFEESPKACVTNSSRPP